MSSTLRIAYFGLPLGALALQQAGFPPCFAAVGHLDAPGMRRLRRLALGSSSLLLGAPDLDRPEIRDALESARPDVVLSWFWPRRIPETILALAGRGAFGVHPSLLPRWRGPDPYFWALVAGDVESGVTLHRLEAQYDTGAIVSQRRCPIQPSDDAWRLARRLDRPGLALLVDCAARLAQGELLTGCPQDPSAATPAPFPDPAQLAIGWHEPVARILRLIRAAAPYPGAYCTLDQETLEVLRAAPYQGQLPRALAPTDAVLSALGVVVCAADGGVLLQRVRREDGSILSGMAIAALFRDGLSQVR